MVCVLAQATPCFAEESAPPQAPATEPPAPTSGPNAAIGEARDSFALGAALARHEQWVDALVAFERSYRLFPHATTLFNIGFCERALGRFTRARKSFRSALALGTPDKPDLDPELGVEARGYLEEIERRIVRATVTIRQPSLTLTINGRPLEAETSQPQGRTFFVAGTRDAGPPEAPPVAVFELLLDPGQQTIVISTGGVDHVITRRFEAGSAPHIELSAPAPPPAAPAEKPPNRASMLVPAIAYGVGAAGLVVGTVFGLATLENAKDLEEQCPDKKNCPPTAQADLDASERNSMIANIAFGVGIAGGIVGTWFVLTGNPKDSANKQGNVPVIRAGFGLGHAKVEGRF